jgi:outer membrane protein
MKNKYFNFIIFLFAVNLNANIDILLPSKAYELALKNSNEIKSSDYQLKAKEENINQVESKLKPRIDISISHSKTDYEMNSLQIRNNYDISEDSTDVTFSLKQTLYDKEIYSNIKLENYKFDLFQSKVEMQKQELVKDVFPIYLLILDSKSKIKLLESIIALNTQRLKVIQKRYNIQLANKMDLLQAKLELNRSKIDLYKQKKIDKVNILKLKQIISIDDINIPSIDTKIQSIKIVDNISNFINNDNLNINNSLALKQAKIALKVANIDIQSAKASHLPKLSFDARYTKYYSDDSTTDYKNHRRLMLTLSLPLYHGGGISSKIQSTKLIKKASNEDIIVATKDLKVKYDELKSIINSSLESVVLHKEAIDSAKIYLESIILGYENGLKSSVDLYDAKDKVLQVEYEFSRNFYELLNSYIEFLIIINRLDKLDILDKLVSK